MTASLSPTLRRRLERTVHAAFGIPLCLSVLFALSLPYCPYVFDSSIHLERWMALAIETIRLGFVVLLLLTAAYTDCTRTKIYNWLTYPTIAWGLLWAIFATLRSMPLQEHGHLHVGIEQALAGALGCGLLMLVPYSMSRGGAGDVKLAAALGALVGFEIAFWSLAGGYICAAVFILARKLWIRLRNTIASTKKVSPSEIATLGLASCLAWSKPLGSLNVKTTDSTLANSREEAIPMAGFFALGAAFVLAGSLL